MEDFEARSALEGPALAGRRVTGHAAVFDTPTRLADGIFEQVARGAFAKSLASGNDVILTHEHNPGALLASIASGTLELREDARGLAMRAELPDTQLGRDTGELVASGRLKHMSFRWRIPPVDEWRSQADGSELRTLRELDLIDVTLTAFPVYPDATAAMRSRDGFRDTLTVPVQVIRNHRTLGLRAGLTLGD